MSRRVPLAAVLSAVALAFPVAAMATPCGHCSGTGPATPSDGLVHQRVFSLHEARHAAQRFERGWPARVGRCHWRTRWEAACAVRFKGPIFVEESSPAVFTWTDLIAVNTEDLRYRLGEWSVESVDLQQIGTINITS